MQDGENVVKKVLAAFTVSLALSGAAFAQAKIQVGCTATSDCASVMLAVDEGIFKNHGLAVDEAILNEQGLGMEMPRNDINANAAVAPVHTAILKGGETATIGREPLD